MAQGVSLAMCKSKLRIARLNFEKGRITHKEYKARTKALINEYFRPRPRQLNDDEIIARSESAYYGVYGA